jgi:hypothetical protein
MPRFNEIKELEQLPRWRLLILALVLLAFILSGLTVRWSTDVVLPRIYKGAAGAERVRVINNDGTLSNGDKLTKSQNMKFGNIQGAVWVIACAVSSLLMLRLWPARKTRDDLHSAL